MKRLILIASIGILTINLTTKSSHAQGQWRIKGTNRADFIQVGVDELDRNYLVADVNGKLTFKLASQVSNIRVDGFAGNDTIKIYEGAEANLKLTLLVGGNGDDIIHGGYGRDRIFGGNGDDTIYGYAGNDLLDGGDGNDYISGGTGNNTMRGRGGSNEIVETLMVRVPAEWEPQDNIWMQWPKGSEVSFRSNFAGIIRLLRRYQEVNILVTNNAMRNQARNYLRQRRIPLANIKFHIMQYDWSWLRDNGPIWAEQYNSDGTIELVCQDWGFDGWGGVGGPAENDDAIPAQLAEKENARNEAIGLVTERGSFEFNGVDTLIASWPVMTNRNPGVSRSAMVREFREVLGVTKVVWLESFSEYDLTRGHVDGVARFVDANTVAVGQYVDQNDPEAALYEEAAQIISDAGFNVIRVTIPGYYRYRNEWAEANYMNYLVVNGAVIVASHGKPAWDNAAKAEIQALYPNRNVHLTDMRQLWHHGGAVHCVTNDKPLFSNK